jgi:hypothetical protein
MGERAGLESPARVVWEKAALALPIPTGVVVEYGLFRPS